MTLPRSQIRTSAAWAIAESVVTLLSSLLVTVFIARSILPFELGIAAVAIFVGLIAEVLVGTIFAEALIRARTVSMERFDTAFTASLITAALVFVMVCCAAPFLAQIFSSPALTGLVMAQATTSLLTGLRTAPEALLLRKLRFKVLSIRNIWAKLASSGVCILLIWLGFGAWGLVLGNITFNLISAILILAALRRRPRLDFNLAHAKELLSYGRFSMADVVLSTATPRIFALLIGAFHGAAAIGYLNAAFRIADSLWALMNAVASRMALPMIARVSGDPAALRSTFRLGTRLLVVVGTPAFVGLAVLGKDVLGFMLGPNWQPAAMMLTAAAIQNAFQFSRSLAPATIKTAGRPSDLIVQHGLGLVFVVAASALTAPLGVEIQTWVWAAFGLFYWLVSAAIIKRSIGISLRDQLAPQLRILAATAVMAGAVFFLQPLISTWFIALRLLVSVSAGVLVFVALIALIERQILSDLFAAERKS